MRSFSFASMLLSWFDQQGRHDLPWRHHINAYRVWVSEIMLQQTQVTTVIPYYQRFLATFPTVHELANAAEDEVLHLWSGLGYYTRARNLHRAAQLIMRDYQGNFPSTFSQVIALPGIGKSTAGAILSIALGQIHPILDGNVKRILTRYQTISGWPGHAAVEKKLWGLAASYTPVDRTNDYTQAIMDLGATICTRHRPQCDQCPVAQGCLAYRQGVTADFPHRRQKKITPVREVKMLLLCNTVGEVLLIKRPPTGIWGGLWGFPELDASLDIQQFCVKYYGLQVVTQHHWPAFIHVFSHFKLNIHPIKIKVKTVSYRIMETREVAWYNVNSPMVLGLAAPVKRLLSQYKEQYNHAEND